MLVFLGTGAGPGVPSFFCGCPACEEAAAEPRHRRTRCSLLVQRSSVTLLDAPPDIRQQFLREGVKDVDQLVLTHAHYDHAGGLGDLEFLVRVRRGAPVPAYMTAATWQVLLESWGTTTECLEPHVVSPGRPFVLDGLSYTPLEVTHAPGTAGFLLEDTAGQRTAYIPDTGPLPRATMDLVRGVDRLVLGATFWGRNWMPEDHLSVDEALLTAREASVGALYLTHLSMHYDKPVTVRELDAYVRSRGDSLHVAHDGLRLTI